MTAPPSPSVVHGAPAQPQDLPATDRLLRHAAVQPLLADHGHTLVADEARVLLAACRAEAVAGTLDRAQAASDALAQALAARIAARLAPRMRPVLNLTGTVIHTNLGRAVLADVALDHVAATLRGPNNLEYDLTTGGRGDRDSLVEDLLCTLTGAEAATVVNNNAAAVVLTLAALAGGREAIVSRGELVEIGGAFRMPDVMAAAGAHMVEVGTTNRTHAQDYARAITERTAVLLKVHTSNYAVQGFTAAVDEEALAPIAHAHGLALVTDLGSGALVDMSRWGLPREPLPQDMLGAGCDVVTFSGDKLLGGPQAGLIVGRQDAIARIRRHPLKRALRLSKLPLAALEATLRLYLQPERLTQALPTLRLLTRPLADIEAVARTVQPVLQAALGEGWRVVPVALQSQIGSGSLPIDRLPSAGLAIAPQTPRKGRALDALAAALRALPVPVIGRVADDRLLLDLRGLEDAHALTSQLHALVVAP
ncbi:MAG: L-seryl-tRNA(Sec) selenium transferase [Proteobacteria bacterium]|nr:L-seryl-tRNA(Sec) selenium transferase [Pseudomonadota bacterium]